jgi:steroid delta-isomerase-like uncharacterized protein
MNTKDLIKSYYEAFNGKRYADMLALLNDDIVHDTNQGRRSQGKEAFRSFLQDMDRFYDEHLDDIAIMVHDGQKRAAAEFICNGVYKTSAPGLPPARQQRYRLPVGCFFEIEGQRITRVTNYYNLNDWLEQVR